MDRFPATSDEFLEKEIGGQAVLIAKLIRDNHLLADAVQERDQIIRVLQEGGDVDGNSGVLPTSSEEDAG